MQDHLSVRQPTCHCGVRQDFCKTIRTVMSSHLLMRFHHPLHLFLKSTPACTFEWVLVTWRRMDQHEFRSILQQDLVVLSHRLFEKVTDELVFHKPWTANQDALNHWWTIKSKRERIEKVKGYCCKNNETIQCNKDPHFPNKYSNYKEENVQKPPHRHTCLSVC